MNRNQVLQNLYRLQKSADIFDKEIRVALNFAMIELSGEGKAEMPEKVRKILDQIETDTKRLTNPDEAAQRKLEIDSEEKVTR